MKKYVILLGFALGAVWGKAQVTQTHLLKLQAKKNNSTLDLRVNIPENVVCTKPTRWSRVALTLPDPESSLAFFCKIEHEWAKKTRIPMKFRLGSVEYVDWLEGK